MKGKYSYIGLNPYEEMISIKNKTIIRDLGNGRETTFDMDALSYIKKYFPKIDTPLRLPFSVRAIGFVGYDAYRNYVKLGEEQEIEIEIRDIQFKVDKDDIV